MPRFSASRSSPIEKSALAVTCQSGLLCGLTLIASVASAAASGPATSSTARAKFSDSVALADAPIETSGVPPEKLGWPKPLFGSPVNEKPREPPAVIVIPSCVCSLNLLDNVTVALTLAETFSDEDSFGTTTTQPRSIGVRLMPGRPNVCDPDQLCPNVSEAPMVVVVSSA